MWILMSMGAAAAPVVLEPQLPLGRVTHWLVTQSPDGEPVREARAAWEVVGIDDDRVELQVTVRAPNPYVVLSMLWPEFVSTRTAWVQPGRADLDQGVTLEDAAFGSCTALPGLWVVLPEGPVEVGAAWSVGAMDCGLTTISGAQATMDCEGSRPAPGRATGVTESVARRVVFDRDHGLVTRCDATIEHTAAQPELSFVIEEVATGELGAPDPGGSGCNRPAGVALGALLAGAIGLLARRRFAV